MIRSLLKPAGVLSLALVAACQSPQLTQDISDSDKPIFDKMFATAQSCINKNGQIEQCYRQAFPQRCVNFAAEMQFNKSTTQKKLTNCVSACQQSTIASRSFGACAIVL